MKLTALEDIEFLRKTLLAVSPFYPGFLPEVMAKHINDLCDTAEAGLPAVCSGCEGTTRVDSEGKPYHDPTIFRNHFPCPVCQIGPPVPPRLMELLAAIEHQRWADWMAYLFKKGGQNPDGSFTINQQSVAHWKRQIALPYGHLTEPEKQSDRKQVVKYWPTIKNFKD